MFTNIGCCIPVCGTLAFSGLVKGVLTGIVGTPEILIGLSPRIRPDLACSEGTVGSVGAFIFGWSRGFSKVIDWADLTDSLFFASLCWTAPVKCLLRVDSLDSFCSFNLCTRCGLIVALVDDRAKLDFS